MTPEILISYICKRQFFSKLDKEISSNPCLLKLTSIQYACDFYVYF